LKRCLDVNDRVLRKIVTALDVPNNGIPSETGFVITAASELMAVLCLADDLDDLRKRIDAMLLGFTFAGEPFTTKDLSVTGAITALLKDAILPNLVQTLEGCPAVLHGGPFANIAHGCNSIIATKTAMQYGDYVITEAGFASDLGAEKFFNIKCRYSGLTPHAAVIVATVRALKMHGGGPDVVAGKPLDHVYKEEALDFVRAGTSNLIHHIKNVLKYGVKPVVAINRFSTDTEAELELVRTLSLEAGAYAAVVANHWAKGGAGATDLGLAVADACKAARSDGTSFK
jgi:formyltetrahydrofolate synthetase